MKFPSNCATRFDKRKHTNGSVSAGAASSSPKETCQRCVSAARLTIAAATWSTNATTNRSYSAKTETRWSLAENLNALWKGISVTSGDARVSLSSRRIRAIYDSMSSIYDLLTRYEKGIPRQSPGDRKTKREFHCIRDWIRNWENCCRTSRDCGEQWKGLWARYFPKDEA